MATEIYFATNRNQLAGQSPSDFGGSFNTRGASLLQFGEATVNTASDVRSSTVQSANIQAQSSDHVQQQLTAALTGGSDLVLYIHGFSTSFHDSLKEAAAIKDRYQSTAGNTREVLVFSWPSDPAGRGLGAFFQYISDRTDATASSLALAQLMKQLSELRSTASPTPSAGRIHLIAQSMGNFALRHGIQKLKMLLPTGLSAQFDEVVLAAADEDYAAFEQASQLEPLPTIANRVTVYFNSGDGLLSGPFRGNRLGRTGPRKPRDVDVNVSLVDCSQVVNGNALDKHAYFLLSPRVRSDINKVFDNVPSNDTSLNRSYDATRNHFVLQ